MTTFITDADSCLNNSYESHSSPVDSSSCTDGYTALVESLLFMNASPEMDDNLASPMSNYTHFSSSMSPMSSTSEGSTYNLQNLNIISNDYNPNQVVDCKYEPYLTVVEEPTEKFRFRYKSEMHGTHGSLTGRSSPANGKKTFPTVQLHNFYGHAVVRCSLSQLPSWRNPRPAPHSHSLVIRMGNEDKKDPHEVLVSPSHGYVATFQGMGIIHTARKYIEDELFGKFKARALYDKSQWQEDATLKGWAKREASEMNLNQVCLCYEAYEQRDGDWVQICEPIYSKPINNMKSALTGELRITRLSSIVGSPAGGEEIFMFVEKVGKKNIKVRFCETDEPEHDLWEGWGHFTEADVHHQYGIALRTPKYKDGFLEKTEKIYIQLLRPSDNTLSEPLEFYYKPDGSSSGSGRKRARVASECSLSEVPSVITDDHMFNTPDASSASQAFQDSEISNIMETWSDIDWEKLSEFLDDGNISNLAKDSVASVASNADKSKAAHAFIQKTLNKMLAIMLMSAKKADFEKGRQYIEALFSDVKYRADGVLDLAIKSNSQHLSKLLEIVQKCRLQKVLRFTNEDNENCLHIACLNDRSAYVRMLLKLGADPNLADLKGNTPLHSAVQKQSIDCVTALLTDKIALNQYNDDGLTPFHLAVANNDLAICQMLEEKALSDSVSIHDRAELKKGNSILHIAVETRAIDIIRYLLKTNRIEVNVQNASGHTPLYLARALDAEQAKEVIKLLLANKAIDIGDSSDGETEERISEAPNAQSKTFAPEVITNRLSNQRTNPWAGPSIESQLQRKESPINPLNLQRLCEIFNENEKWKSVAIELGYRNHIDDWHKRSDPAKMLFKFAEATRVPRSRFSRIFVQLNEHEAWKIVQTEQ